MSLKLLQVVGINHSFNDGCNSKVATVLLFLLERCFYPCRDKTKRMLCSKTMELVTFVRKLQGDLEVYTAAISNWFICRPCVMERYQNLAKNDSKKVVLSCSWVQLGVLNRLRSDWLKIITRGSCTMPT